ncbi:arginine--tRNA ligase [Flavobacterium aurantiibacter]|uniref:Arginine--tRNA ligase n=1 Tax=Flavobacterium aurantiibacter TaxID=2023067 RepID=A0A256A2T7_9FLAO|nr:arginine--tRNA ligase [Flavobacterium aurantiibacter]OYQ47414.1 arginine--tRNA ligase [Flavobacterium aurantiibacter]
MTLKQQIETTVTECIQSVFSNIDAIPLEVQLTKKEFEGDFTVVLFPLVKTLKLAPAQIGEQLGALLLEKSSLFKNYNIVSGFLNLTLQERAFTETFSHIFADSNFGSHPISSEGGAIVEFSSPNTNKPLHLGHIRNILLGFSVSRILEAAGKKVHKTQIINDRGIHICKSMLAWQRFGNSETPQTAQMKGDHFVGKYYVKFNIAYEEEIKALEAKGLTKDEAKKQAPIFLEAQDMLRKWEAGDAEVVSLWKTMNQWVYEGFETTYRDLEVDFDSYYYESETYLLGKSVVTLGLEKGVFEQDPDGSVWIDLTADGLDRKIVLRADGTAVYMTQDIGTAIQRMKDQPGMDQMIFTVGNEQDYHFKVLFLILKKLGFSWANQLHHLSYGMVDLPTGKMKSREGIVVDADDLIAEVIDTATAISQELGKLDGYSEEEKSVLYRTIGLGAMKYFLLKIDPKKKITYNPKESVDFNGNTGPFIQYAHARIQSILRKAGNIPTTLATVSTLDAKEIELIKVLEDFPAVVKVAAAELSPALIANYAFDLVKAYNSFYQSVSILGESDENTRTFRVQLSAKTAEVIKKALYLLGIQSPERM